MKARRRFRGSHLAVAYIESEDKSQKLTHEKTEATSSIISTLARLRIARAMQISCFSLLHANKHVGDSYPVEKLSPPSDTGESRFLNTLAFTIPGSSSDALPDGIRWTRRRASNCGTRMLNVLAGTKKLRLTISASSYSSKTSNVDLNVPLKIVGSSGKKWDGPTSRESVLTRNDSQTATEVCKT